MQNNDSRRDHVLRRSLEEALEAIANGAEVSDVVTGMLRTLDQQRMISYAPSGSLGLLSTHGRVLVAIMEDPEITQRALSVYLGVSESNVQKSIKSLSDAKLIVKSRVNKSNSYSLNLEDGIKHPDISRFYDAIVSELVRKNETGEEAPF